MVELLIQSAREALFEMSYNDHLPIHMARDVDCFLALARAAPETLAITSKDGTPLCTAMFNIPFSSFLLANGRHSIPK